MNYDKELYETAVEAWNYIEKEFQNHVPEIGERCIQTCCISSELIPDLTPGMIDYFFKDAYIPEGCIFEKEEIDPVGFIRRTFIYKGEKTNG